MILSALELPIPSVERLGEIDSTSAEAARRAHGGDFGPVWLQADRQTAARGRNGRDWAAPEGNLYATLLVPCDLPPGQAALTSFVACLAVADLLDTLSGSPARTTLKWPNDPLFDGRKIAGVLLESGQGWLTVGIGVNLAHYPDGARWPATSVAEGTGRPAPTPLAALDVLSTAYAHREATFREEGFGPIRRAWLSRAAHLGEPIEVRMPKETLTGTFEGIAEDGTLMLETPDGPRRIAAADVHFPGGGADAARD